METKENISRLLLNLSNTVIKNRNRHLEAINLTASQADCIKFFLHNNGASIKDFSVATGITHQTAQGIVSRLLDKKYLRVEKSEKDKRSQRVFITEEGLAITEKIKENARKTADLLLKDMTENEVEEFIRLLKKAYSNIKNDWLGDEKIEEQH